MEALASAIEALARLMRGRERILLFTGAGISTGSGIPDFRGPNGIWTRRQPVYFDEFLADERKRVDYWDYKLEGWDGFRDARPNVAHDAVVALQARGVVIAVVTQNIDGLHQLAGSASETVYEIHGTNRFTECLGCGRRDDPAPAMEAFRAARTPPRCSCGGLLKMATISFGQPLDEAVLRRCILAAEQADLVVALGSTLSVHPAAAIPLISVGRRVPYAVVNRGETDHDELATIKIDADVAQVLPSVVARL